MNQDGLKRALKRSAEPSRPNSAVRLVRRATAEKELMVAMRRALADEAVRQGFDSSTIGFREATLSLSVDPVSGEESLVGDWCNARGQRTGGFVIHADGSFYAEEELVRRHPGKPQCIVESIMAWGCCDIVHAESRFRLAS